MAKVLGQGAAATAPSPGIAGFGGALVHFFFFFSRQDEQTFS